MFTGLIEAVGNVVDIKEMVNGMQIGIGCPEIASGIKVGDSVNVDGVCLTVTARTGSGFAVQAVGDTLRKTTFRKLSGGMKVNLERALRADGRLGGHFVMGHAAGTARILSWGPGQAGGAELEAWFLVLGLSPEWSDRVAPEGSIAVDGISLTVAEIMEPGLRIRISVIPHTRARTTLAVKKPGDEVNIELDVLASYAGAALRTALKRKAGGLRREQLRAWGYA